MTKSAFSIIRSSRASALALLLATPILAGAAHANDEYGTGHEAVISQAARSTGTSPLSAAEAEALYARFNTGENDVFGAAGAPRPGPAAARQRSRLASTALTVAGEPDVVGAGGHQDDVAREIYHPGTGTTW